ncbi:MAG: bifunctional ornithine acetyltransferase/N-acetylglutamate synthase, partial [Paracoccaceae bacterium]|nr:bifunctional ornithine acetyltransferase/N-acetylglutamate synthase [Paracoccaceae bacterium]
MKNTISKFAPKNGFPHLPIIDGIKLSAVNAGISKTNKLDLLLVRASKNSTICALFTKSKTCSAAVDWSRQNLEKVQNQQKPLGLLVNSGNANVFTGPHGETTVRKSITSTAHHLKTSDENIFVASTGVIGELLHHNQITSQIENLTKNLKPSMFLSAAEAI